MDIEKLKSLSLGEIRIRYRAYLESKELSQNTIQTSCSDAFYILRHDNELDFWRMIEGSEWETVACKRLRNILSQNSKGNADKNLSGYMFHLRMLREFIMSNLFIYPVERVDMHNLIKKNKVVSIKNIIPTPSSDEVEKYLSIWNTLDNYYVQEVALNRLFHDLCPCNKDINDVLLKVSTLNDFYSTNIFSVYPVAKHILKLDIDERLRIGDYTLVKDIQYVTISGQSKSFYSFATKYCSHHNPYDFPIYDSYVDKVLCYFQKTDRYERFTNQDLKDYDKFKNILNRFREFYSLEQYELKQIDQYLWLLGKEYFPKKY